jgi:uncharacterized protein YndB with AHSA1/START domain
MYQRKLEHEIVIQRPRQEVYDYVTQPFRWHEWHPASESATKAEAALNAGDSFGETVSMKPLGFLPIRVRQQLKWTVTETGRPTAWEAQATSKLIDLQLRYELEAQSEASHGSGAGTRFHRTFHYTAKGWTRPIERFIVMPRMKRQSSIALKNLKRTLETRDSSASPRENNALTVAYRKQYRQQFIGPRYRGWLHFAFTVALASTIIVLSAMHLQSVTLWEWLTVPLTFLYANFAEYFGHRGPMHHPRRTLHMVYERHTRQHHRFFTDSHMAFDDTRDFKAVLFPPVLVTFFLLAFGSPAVFLLAWMATWNVACLFALTVAAYFLNYELLHFSYHLPREHLIARLPGMAALRRHHTVHHDPALMSQCNFNISYPIADWVLGTLHHDSKETMLK